MKKNPKHPADKWQHSHTVTPNPMSAHTHNFSNYEVEQQNGLERAKLKVVMRDIMARAAQVRCEKMLKKKQKERESEEAYKHWRTIEEKYRNGH